MKEITQDNIALIRAICNKNGITFYDVQLEAIDHIASMIEHRWELFPNEDFITALDAVIMQVDWRPFRYKNNSELTTQSWSELNKNNKRVQIFASLLFVSIILIGLLDFKKMLEKINLQHLTYWFSISQIFLYGLGVIFIIYNFKKAKAMLSFAHNKKYKKGLTFGILMLLVTILRMVVNFQNTNQGLLIGSLASIAFLVMFIFQFILPIIKARRQYPHLF
jgi:hypothetical protein